MGRLWGGLCDSHILSFMPLCESLPLSMDRTHDFLLINRILQRRWAISDYMYVIISHKIIMPVSLLQQLWRNKLPHCELPVGEEHMTKSWGKPLAKGNKKLKHSNQQHTRNWTFPKLHEFERGSFPSETSDVHSLGQHPIAALWNSKTGDPAQPWPDFGTTETVI